MVADLDLLQLAGSVLANLVRFTDGLMAFLQPPR